MIKTRLTELVGIKYPIIQAGMGPYPVTSLCIAAANAGCLGLCSTFATASRETNKVVFDDFCKQAHADPSDDDVTIFKKMFTRVFEETKESDGIFGANVMVSAELRQNAANVMKAIKGAARGSRDGTQIQGPRHHRGRPDALVELRKRAGHDLDARIPRRPHRCPLQEGRRSGSYRFRSRGRHAHRMAACPQPHPPSRHR